jgi:hypothetical protein
MNSLAILGKELFRHSSEHMKKAVEDEVTSVQQRLVYD